MIGDKRRIGVSKCKINANYPIDKIFKEKKHKNFSNPPEINSNIPGSPGGKKAETREPPP